MNLAKNKVLTWCLLGLAIALLDQFSKWLATTYLIYQQPVSLLSFFNLTLAHNTGAAFSFLGDAGGWQRWFFIGITVAIIFFLLRTLFKLSPTEKLTAFAIALVLGGAIGNLYDRVVLGYVIDFFDFHINDWHYPIFIVADSAICIGVSIWLIVSLKNRINFYG